MNHENKKTKQKGDKSSFHSCPTEGLFLYFLCLFFLPASEESPYFLNGISCLSFFFQINWTQCMRNFLFFYLWLLLWQILMFHVLFSKKGCFSTPIARIQCLLLCPLPHSLGQWPVVGKAPFSPPLFAWTPTARPRANRTATSAALSTRQTCPTPPLLLQARFLSGMEWGQLQFPGCWWSKGKWRGVRRARRKQMEGEIEEVCRARHQHVEGPTTQ